MEDEPQLCHQEYPPSKYLLPFVRRILHSYGPEGASTTIAVPPTGAHYITHVYNAPMRMSFSDVCWSRCPELFVGGQLKNEMPVAETAQNSELLGIEFQPTGFYRLFKRVCSTFTDCITDFLEIAPDGGELLETLPAQVEVTNKINTLECFLSRFVEDAVETPRVDHAVALIEQSDGCIRMEDLAKRCHWTPKQMYRQFVRTVGVGPKPFAKIVQINRVVTHMLTQNSEGLQEAALRCGYYDQAHFIHDFQRLIGTNPLAFLHHPDPFLKNYLGRAASLSG
ncbi:helix-turn-helix domain-containing protein [Thiohalomonas denitrificans]|nr:helix-turn-helix transcriptional regulator [Thiohalomonas denitrificans]